MPNRCSSTSGSKPSLVIQAYNPGKIKSLNAAARLYGVPYLSLYTLYHGTPSKRESQPATRKLIYTEKEDILQRILDLDAQGFPPRTSVVREIDARQNSTTNRWPELGTKLYQPTRDSSLVLSTSL